MLPLPTPPDSPQPDIASECAPSPLHAPYTSLVAPCRISPPLAGPLDRPTAAPMRPPRCIRSTVHAPALSRPLTPIVRKHVVLLHYSTTLHGFLARKVLHNKDTLCIILIFSAYVYYMQCFISKALVIQYFILKVPLVVRA